MSFINRLLSKPFRPDPKLLKEQREKARSLASAVRWRRKDKVVQDLAEGADPTQPVLLEAFGTPTNAILEALSQNQPALMTAILEAGFRLSDYEVQKAVRAVQQQPDFDGHPGEVPSQHDMIRVLYQHGERFTALMGDPRFPEQTQADFIRHHAPSLSDLDLTTPAFGAGLEHRAPAPVATTAEQRQYLTISLGVYSDQLDEVRELLRRGADPMHLSYSLAPRTLMGRAIDQGNVAVFMLSMNQGMTPSPDDLRSLTSRILYECDRPVEIFGESSHHQMIRILFAKGERFDALVDEADPSQGTLADRIQRHSPTLARDLDWSSSAPMSPVVETSPAKLRRRGP